jgi:hypothetical protein
MENPMRQFPLEVGSQLLNFDTDGNVSDSAANVIGRWSTEANAVKLVRSGGAGSETVDMVSFAFNDKNQLVIAQAGKPVFTLVNTPDGLPTYSVDAKNRLVVDPDGDRDFQFTLEALWGLNTDGNLLVSIGGAESVLDGFLDDNNSRFRFGFDDKESPTVPSRLLLKGGWERKAAVANEIRLHFVLDDPTLEIKSRPLDLPAAVKVDPSRNHLALVYQSKSKGERRLQFAGSFEIRPNMTLVFRIDDVKDAGLRKSRIEVETIFAWDTGTGSLQFFVGKESGKGVQKIEVGGALKAQLKGGTLEWTFAYRKATAGGTTTLALATQLSFVSDKGKLLISYMQDGKVKQFDISGQVDTGKVVFGGGLSIKNDPQGRSVKAFIGVSW